MWNGFPNYGWNAGNGGGPPPGPISLARVALAVGAAAAFAMAMWGLFSIKGLGEVLQVMSVSFIFLMPIVVGAATVYLSPIRLAHSGAYQFFAPWASVLVFFVLTMVLGLEGLICWIMILPFLC